MHTFNISKLRHKLIIEVPEYKKDGYGGYEVVWKEGQEIWAHVLPLYVYKSDSNKSLGKRMQYKITTRANPTLTHSIKLKYENKLLSIIAIAHAATDENFINILTKEDYDNSDQLIQNDL